MKKFTLSLCLMIAIGLTSFAQGLNQVSQNQNFPAKRNQNYTVSNSGQSALKGAGVGINALAVSYSDDFSSPNDTDGLKARGYIPYYRGVGPAGTFPCWFQGNATNWGDFNNSTDEYVCSNFQSVTLINNIDNWLVLPALNVASGDRISFYSQSPSGSTFVDSIRVMYSAAGDSTPEDLSWVELGRFQVNVNGGWEQDSFTVASAGPTARFAIRYTVPDSGPDGSNGDLIGIDQLDVFTPGSSGVGINENELDKSISIYPNPSTGIIHINSSKSAVYSLQIFNTLGQKVYGTGYDAFSQATIDLSAQPSGVYHLKLSTGNASLDKVVILSGS